MARNQGNTNLTHTVDTGDTLYDIAQVYYGDANLFHHIAQANNNLAPNSLIPGQRLVLPHTLALNDGSPCIITLTQPYQANPPQSVG